MLRKFHPSLLLIVLFSCRLSSEIESFEYSPSEGKTDTHLEVVELDPPHSPKFPAKHFAKRYPRTSLCIGAILASSVASVCFGLPSVCLVLNSMSSSVSNNSMPIANSSNFNSLTPTSYAEIEKASEMSFSSTSSHQLTHSDGSPITFQNETLSNRERAKLAKYPAFKSDRWMTDIFPILKNKKIWQVSAIGSHNAFNYFGKDLTFCNTWTYPTTIYYNQKDSPAEQFDKGVRYFDTRIKVTSDGLESFHGGYFYWFGNNRIEESLIALANKVRGTKDIIILHLRESEHIDSKTGLIKNELMKFFKKNMDDLIVKRNEIINGNLYIAQIKDILKSGNIILIDANYPSTEYKNYIWDLLEFMPDLHYSTINKSATPRGSIRDIKPYISYYSHNKSSLTPCGYTYDPANGNKFVDLHKKAIKYNSYFLNYEINRWLKDGLHFYLSMDFTDADEGYASRIAKKMYEYYILN